MSRREKSERHRALNFTQPADLPPPRWIQAAPERHSSPLRRLVVAIALVAVLALCAVLWPGIHP